MPLVDSAWDVVQTVARPLVGGTIGALVAGEDGATALVEAGAAGGSGGLALASHSAKASIRLAVNSSPEPFSNVAISLAEDLAVALVVLLATEYPWLAAGGGGGAAGLRRDPGAVPGQGGAGRPAPAAGAPRAAVERRRAARRRPSISFGAAGPT